MMRLTALMLVIALAVTASAQSTALYNGPDVPVDKIHSSSTTTFTVAGMLDFNGTVIDLDPTGDYTLDLDAGSTATITVADTTDNAFAVVSGSNRWIDLDLGTTDILRLTQTAGTNIAIGNSTGTFQLDSDALDVSTAGVISGATGITTTGVVDADSFTADAGAGLDTQAAGTLPIGAATATKVEIADAGVETEIQGTLDVQEQATFTLGIQTVANVGTAGANCTAVEYGDGYHHVTVITMTGAELTPTIPADAEGAGCIIYTFPAGAYVGTACHMDITGFVADSATNSAFFGIGSVIASGDIAVITSPATLIDWVTSQAVANISSPAKEKTTTMTAGAPVVFEAAGSHVLHFNTAGTWNSTIATAAVTGTVTIYWTFLGE